MSPAHTHALTFDSDPYSVTNFVDRMHGECSRLQWLRELVVNSIEAIAATGEEGKILVHAVDQDMGDGMESVRKLAVTDTGEGIAANELYSSFQVAMTSRGRGNYGIGAKIAALPMNPAGMIYRSQIEGGDPAELIWHRTARTGGYYAALEWQEGHSGETQFVTPPSCDESTFSIVTEAGHGTQVVLCGDRPEDDTCKALSPSAAKSAGNLHWAIRELNFKFWKIPKNIEIRVENVKANGSGSGAKNYLIHGGEKGIQSLVQQQGIVDLIDNPYRVRWYLLDREKTKKRNQHIGWGEGKIVATLYREATGVVEVYGMRRMKRGAALMNDFGIYSGAENVILLIEPTRQDLMQPTTARNDLRIAEEGNVSAAYREIGQEFASLMAEKATPLAIFVKQQLEGLKSTSDEQNLRDVIEKAIELYKILDYRRLAKGRLRTSEGGEPRQASRDYQQPDDPKEDRLDSDETDLSQSESDEDIQEPNTQVPTQRNQRRTRPRPRFDLDPKGSGRAVPVPPVIEPKIFSWENLHSDEITNYSTNAQREVKVNTEGETYLRLLALYKSRPDFKGFFDIVEQIVRKKSEACLQLSIFTLEQEFNARRTRLGVDFEAFFEKNTGRVCLDSMASRDTQNAIVREIKNMISKAKSKAAAEAEPTRKRAEAA